MAGPNGKGSHDREADKFEEVATGVNANTDDFPERARGTTSAVRTIPTGFLVGADGAVIAADDAHLDKLVAEDTVTADVFYVGRAAIGSATSAAVWQIKRITVVEGPPLTVDIGWADSDDAFDNIWDNRQSLTYST